MLFRDLPGHRRFLASAYLLLALPLILLCVFLTPPFQVADEENHFLRATQIARGEFVAARLGADNAGGLVDGGAAWLAHAFDGLKFHPERRRDVAAEQELGRISWGAVPPVVAGFGNTAIYPPFAYAPVAAGLRLGRAFRMPILQSLLLARLLNGLACLALATAALGLARRGRLLLFAVLIQPMALSLFASCSQDGPVIALAALAAALLTRVAAPEGAGGTASLLLAGLALGVVAAAKPPYVFLALVLPAAALAAPAGLRGWFARLVPGLVALGLALLVLAGWEVIGALPAKVPFRPGDGVSIGGQLAWLAASSGRAIGVAATTLRQYGRDYAEQFVGVLGWLDTRLPPAMYSLGAASMLVAAGAGLFSPEGGARGQAGLRLSAAAAMLAAVGGVFGALYLSWTPVGAAAVDGVQGRYLLPVAAFLPLLLGPPGLRPSPVVPVARLLLLAYAAALLWVLPMTLLSRYG